MLVIKRYIKKIIQKIYVPEIQDTIGWNGHVHILIQSKNGSYYEEDFDNTVMLVGKNLIRDIIGGFQSNGLISYVAVGTSNTAVSNTQTQLGAEGFRKAVTSYAQGTSGVVTEILYIAPNEANISIQEIGWFAGSLATSSANSGIMIARVLWAHSKVNTENVTISRTDTFS